MTRFYRSDEEQQELEATNELNNPSLDDETFNKKYTAHVNTTTRPKIMGDFHRAEDNIAGARNHAKIQVKGDDGIVRNYADERTARVAQKPLPKKQQTSSDTGSKAPIASSSRSASTRNVRPVARPARTDTKPAKPVEENPGYAARKYDRDLEKYRPAEESQPPETPKGVSSKDTTLDAESEVKAKDSKTTKQNSIKTGFVSPTDFLVQKGVEYLTPFLKKLSKLSDALNGSTYGLYKSVGKAVKK